MNSSHHAGIVCTPWNTIPIPNDEAAVNWQFTKTDKIVLSIILPIIIIVGFFGNIAFLYMVACLKRMHTLTNFYLVNIAIADIITVTYTPVVYGWSYFNSAIIHYMPIENSAGCFTTGAVSYWGYFASINIFTLVSLERWLAICRPLQHISMKSKSRTSKLITFAWFIALVFALLVAPRYGKSIWFCMGWPDSDKYTNMPKYLHTCVSYHKSLETHPAILEFTPYFLGLLINGTFYVMIVQALSNRSIGDVSNPSDQSTTKIRNQVARLLVINGVVFFICQTPFRIANLDNIAGNLFGGPFLTKTQADSIKIFGRTFIYLNSAINVFIYLLSSSFYRNGFREVFSFVDKRHKKDDGSLKTVTTSSTLSGRI